MKKRKCKECEFCKNIGRSEVQRFRLGRKKYYCEHKGTKEIGFKHNNFVGYGDDTFASPLQLKTTPRWCPLVVEDRKLGTHEE